MNSINLPKVIGITGRKSNGKDTVGNFLVDNYGYKRLAFADALKSACKEIFGFNDEQLYGNLKETDDEQWKVSPRLVLQYVGTDLFREQISNIMPHIEKNIWVNVVKVKILKEWKNNPNQKFVITDVRFPNEIDLINELSGLTIRVRRDSCNNTVDSHQSEILIERLPVLYEILNNSTLEELYEKVINILSN